MFITSFIFAYSLFRTYYSRQHSSFLVQDTLRLALFSQLLTDAADS